MHDSTAGGESEFSHNHNAMVGDGVTVHAHHEFLEFVNMTGDEFLEFVDVVRRSCSHEFPEFGAIGVRVMSSWNLQMDSTGYSNVFLEF